MIVRKLTDPEFIPYGKVIEGYDVAPLLEALKSLPRPEDGVVYVPGEPSLEKLPLKDKISAGFYGGMPVQLGYCNGNNRKLNCLEYHRDSELNIAADDIILLVAKLQDLKDWTLDTSAVEAFLAPAGAIVQFYETALHYAPCTAPGKDGFRVAVALPLGTNTEKPELAARNGEDRLLWARNKWLLAHPESPEAGQGAFVGLTGINITI